MLSARIPYNIMTVPQENVENVVPTLCPLLYNMAKHAALDMTHNILLQGDSRTQLTVIIVTLILAAFRTRTTKYVFKNSLKLYYDNKT